VAVAAPGETVSREHALALELSRLLRISPRFARAFTRRFAERGPHSAFLEQPELAEAIDETREWRIVPFPPLPPAPLAGFPQEELKPDLMVAGIGQRHRWLFQLIVEVKLTTPLEQLWIAGRRVAHPAAYAAVWDRIKAKDAADLRYLGTLSPHDQPGWRDDVASLAPEHVRPARDVWWVPELGLSAREALAGMSGGEQARFLPELVHFQRSVRAAAPQLGVGKGGALHGLSLARTARKRGRAARRR
jgi:hypothetical protein